MSPVSAGPAPTVQVHRLPTTSTLDAITVMFIDIEPGRGELVVECGGCAWHCYWGAMSGKDLESFLAAVDAGYVANCLIRSRRRFISSRKAEDTELRLLVSICDRLIGWCRDVAPLSIWSASQSQVIS